MLIADLHERIRQYVLATINSGQLTQRALAEMIGVRQAHISNFLHGRRGLSIAGMDALLGVLGIDVEDLLSMSDQTRPLKDCSIALENVPLIQLRAAMHPTFGHDDILGELAYTKTLLRLSKANFTEKRTAWVRFIAVRADATLAESMYPRFENGSVLLVDRHYCTLAEYRKGEPNLYLIRKGERLMVRWIEMQGSNLCLRPESSDCPLDFISLNKRYPPTSCIVGRVVHIGTELHNSVSRRPLSL